MVAPLLALAQEEKALAERIVGIELERRPTRPVRGSLDLGDDRAPGHVDLADDPARELRADDRAVAKLVAAPSRPSSCRSASRADVPLPHGERSTSPSANTVTFRCVSGSSASCCQKITP